MIVGLGIDSVEIERFIGWANYSQKRLLQIFNLIEIKYALDVPIKVSERFAARFAAKEAAYKALSSLMQTQITLIEFCKHVYVQNDLNGAPQLIVNFEILGLSSSLKTFISITHTNTMANAVVIVESI